MVDYVGQKLSEDLYTYIITGASVIAFLAGYATASFRLMMQIFGAGVAVSLLLCVPPWPFLRRHPMTWLQKKGDGAAGAGGAQGKGGRAAKGSKRN